VTELRQTLEREKAKSKNLWKLNCAQLAEFDSTLMEKDEEIARLEGQLAGHDCARSRSPPFIGRSGSSESGEEVESPSPAHQVQPWRGKAPPVVMFSGEDPELSLSDWLPSLKKAAQWNGWGSEEEILIQLAGYLKGRALQEWNLLEKAERDSYDKAVVALRIRLDTGGKVMAAQDFRHLAQEEKEKVTNFIRRLVRTFHLAYGHNSMSPKTRDTLWFGQLQEGLKYGLMASPAVCGATSYQSFV